VQIATFVQVLNIARTDRESIRPLEQIRFGATPAAAAWQVSGGSVPETGHSVHCSSIV
jgi:hypothetical protein